MGDFDRIIHEPARLLIVTILAATVEADFNYLLQATKLTKGNLSTHLLRLEEAKYVAIEKGFRGKVPMTVVRLTHSGSSALENYRREMTKILKPRKRSQQSYGTATFGVAPE